MALSNDQLTTEVTLIASSLKDVVTALNNLTPKTTVNQLEILNQNDHESLSSEITDISNNQVAIVAKLNASIDLLNRIATRVGLGPSIDPLDL